MVTTLTREDVKNVPKNIVAEDVSFIDSFQTKTQKEELYSKLWGKIGTLYPFPGGRLDIQSRLADATNVQIQSGSQTIATVVISNKLATYDEEEKIAEVINYVLRQFKGGLNYYRKHGQAIVLRVDSRS